MGTDDRNEPDQQRDDHETFAPFDPQIPMWPDCECRSRRRHQGKLGNGPYAASKSGVHRLTEALAEELAETGVTVNAVLPSVIDTPANRAQMPTEDFTRWVQPNAIADVILFLASHQARAMSGALVPVNRGR